jgi:hypothetical protein
MSTEVTKAKLVRDYIASDNWQSIVSQFNTIADEEVVFEDMNKEGRSREPVKSELDRVREWYNVIALLKSLIDTSNEGGKLVAEYIELAAKQIKAATISKILSQDMILDTAVYSEIDWRRLSIKFRKLALTFAEECAKSHEVPEVLEQNLDAYKKTFDRTNKSE